MGILQVNESELGNARRFSHKAMNTRFEIILVHEDPEYSRQAAAEAFRKLDLLEQDLSRFLENSDISRINTSPANQAVRVGLDTFVCLKNGICMAEVTRNAFDVTAGSTGAHRDSAATLAFDEDRFEVRRLDENVLIDLGGIGKGFAVDRMAEILAEWQIESTLIHGGSSTALALKGPSRETGWRITVSRPSNKGSQDHREILDVLHLQHRALSASGVEKGFHIIDPRSGKQVRETRVAWALAADGTTSDALSTAFMVMTLDEIQRFCAQHSGTGAMVSCPGREIFICGSWGN